MIVNLMATLLATTSINTGQINVELQRFDQIKIAETCQIMAIDSGIESPEEEQYAVKDLSDNIFIIQNGETSGFMIYDPIADAFIEKSTTMECPFLFDETYNNYYFGPMNYFYRIDDTFYHYSIDNYSLTLEEANELQLYFNDQLEEFRYETSEEKYEEYRTSQLKLGLQPKGKVKVGNKTYINNYKYIKDAVHPNNYDDSCGFVAASIVMNYWDKTVHSGTVDSSFLDNNGELNDTSSYSPTTNLKDKLVSYNNGVRTSWAKTVSESVNKYCDDYDINGSSSWYIGKVGLEESLLNERPAVMFGWIPNVQSSGQITHAVTCYGVELTWWGGYYIVNYGWGTTYSEVSLGFGFIGSTMTFSLDEESYKANYTIKPTDYNFTSSYNTVEESKAVTIDDLTFSTKRFRCGYIENEYINLSPRRSGFDTAYLEYTFVNPINELSVALSFWSDDERYNSPNEAVALFQYKDLYTNTWIDGMDLLTADLSTDRTNQRIYTFNFTGKTREIRFYTHFDYISGVADRNKGRISIGNMDISTYK